MRRLALALLPLLLAACDSASLESAYPPPGSFPQITIGGLLTAEAGQYNVDGYVERIDCEDSPLADCIPGTNWLYESLADDPPQHALLLVADDPDVFQTRVRYRLSVETDQEIGTPLRPFRVIGAARLD